MFVMWRIWGRLVNLRISCEQPQHVHLLETRPVDLVLSRTTSSRVLDPRLCLLPSDAFTLPPRHFSTRNTTLIIVLDQVIVNTPLPPMFSFRLISLTAFPKLFKPVGHGILPSHSLLGQPTSLLLPSLKSHVFSLAVLFQDARY